MVTLKSFPPISCPYVTLLPPPETTPLLTDSCEAGTPSCVDAIPSSAWYAVAAAARTPGPAFLIVLLAECLPESGVTFVSAITNSSWLMSMFSSSPAIINSPVSDPVPCRIPPDLIDAVLSGLIVIQASTWNWSYGPFDAYGLSAACALPASAAPAIEKPTISAPPPFKNVVRENSRSCRNPVINSLPSPSPQPPA